MQISMSVRIPEELASDLSELAIATGRTKSFLTVEALKSFVQTEKWQIEKIKHGIQQADSGNFATEDDMLALDKKWGFSAD